MHYFSHSRGYSQSSKGFTLIELLVVIAIVAVLSVVVLLTLNPAELLKQARDSNRISDLSTLKTSLSLYLTDVLSPNLASTSLGYASCYLSVVQGANATGTLRCGVFTSSYITSITSSTSSVLLRKVDATGWLPVNLNQVSIGSPLGGALPVDPIGNGNFYYAYAASSTGIFEIDANMESIKYSASGTADIETKDGGNFDSRYEIGNAPGLSL